jgi:hypothetical protein
MLRINKIQFLIGAVALLIGGLVYLVDRPPDYTYFINNLVNVSFHRDTPRIFGSLGNTLPAYVHVFSFILITGALASDKKRDYIIVCLGWCFLDCAFEVGQAFHAWSSRIIPTWFSGIPFLENTQNYFLLGTFDFFDLAAIALGTVTAYFVLVITSKEERRVML